MVALTVNSETLAEILNGDKPYDDKTVADLQIDETIRFVNRHPDFMEIAYSAADAERIIRSNRLAVILGMEVDKIGNFNKPGIKTDERAVRKEIRRLHKKGIRYIFPIHLIDNAFGGAAVYETLFNMANRNQNGKLFSITHSNDPLVQYQANFVSDVPGVDSFTLGGIYKTLEGIGMLPSPNPECIDLFKCHGLHPCVAACGSYDKIRNILKPTSQFDRYKKVPKGHANMKGLTPLGEVAINEMMKLGILIDVDHMSEKAMRSTFKIADGISGDYPLIMGHNRVRVRGDSKHPASERSAPADLVRKIAEIGGMMGEGTAGTNPVDFVQQFNRAWAELQKGGNHSGLSYLGIGTDVNGFEHLPDRGHGSKSSPDIVSMVPGDAWNNPPARLSCHSGKKVNIRSARIGCLDIQHSNNLTSLVASACNGRTVCNYKAPTEEEYRRKGISAATRTFCTQAMEIVYRCTDRPELALNSQTFYRSFFVQSGLKSKQRKPNGKVWDYIDEGGVSHYGLIPEFLHEVRLEDPAVYDKLMGSADYFVRMWKKAELVSRSVK